MPARGRADWIARSQVTSAKLHADDELTASIQCKAVEGSTGSNVRWGFSIDKLYHNWLVFPAVLIR